MADAAGNIFAGFQPKVKLCGEQTMTSGPNPPFFLFAALACSLVLSLDSKGADSPWTNGNRIAISADGNPDADADDVGATALTLAVLAKAGLQP